MSDRQCDLHGLDELGQDAAGGGGMQERDLRAADARARRLVDQPHAAARAARERGLDVVHLVGDVVQPRPPLGQEAPDGRVLGRAA